MNRSEPQLLATILEEIKSRQNLTRRLAEQRAMELWDEVTGSVVASQTMLKDVRDRVLLVRLSSAALRQEISMSQSLLIGEINRMAGMDVINEIRFI